MYIAMYEVDSSIIGIYSSKIKAKRELKKLGISIYDVELEEYEMESKVCQ